MDFAMQTGVSLSHISISNAEAINLALTVVSLTTGTSPPTKPSYGMQDYFSCVFPIEKESFSMKFMYDPCKVFVFEWRPKNINIAFWNKYMKIEYSYKDGA